MSDASIIQHPCTRLSFRSPLVKMVFEAVYVDTEAKEIVAYRPKDQYRALFTLGQGLREKARLLFNERYDELVSIGDPDRSRGRQYLWTSQN